MEEKAFFSNFTNTNISPPLRRHVLDLLPPHHLLKPLPLLISHSPVSLFLNSSKHLVTNDRLIGCIDLLLEEDGAFLLPPLPITHLFEGI